MVVLPVIIISGIDNDISQTESYKQIEETEQSKYKIVNSGSSLEKNQAGNDYAEESNEINNNNNNNNKENSIVTSENITADNGITETETTEYEKRERTGTSPIENNSTQNNQDSKNTNNNRINNNNTNNNNSVADNSINNNKTVNNNAVGKSKASESSNATSEETTGISCNLDSADGYYKYELEYRKKNTSAFEGDELIFYNNLKQALDNAYQYSEPWYQEKEIHDWIVDNCKYDIENYNNNTIPYISYKAEGIFINKTAVCDGYSKAFKLCMDILGIENKRVVGIGHSWNMVKLEGGMVSGRLYMG